MPLLHHHYSEHCKQVESATLQCEIECRNNLSLLLIVKTNEWQEQASLSAMPNDSVLEQQRQSLADISLANLLRQIQARQDELLQQRNALKLETDRLATKLIHRNRDMEYQSMHDELTGLPNRPLLAERANHAFQIAQRQQFNCCLMLMDLNDFKNINDALGHQIGDLMLQEVASRFKNSLRTSDTLARLGGDEFAVLLLNNRSEQAEIVAEN